MTSNPVPGIAERMGLRPDMIVMEFGYDDDVDMDLRDLIADTIGEDLLDEDSDEVADMVLVWYRDGASEADSDLADVLVDAIGPLADDGVIWLVTPKRGRTGHVEASDISEAAAIAGLSQTSIAPLGADWAGTRLVGRKSHGGKR